MGKRRLTTQEVLQFSMQPRHRSTVRRFYDAWRRDEGLPTRCDNEHCEFYKRGLKWNGSLLLPILDHINGNSKDNRPENLRLLCPNCDSQLPTRGGKNKGRIQNQSERGFAVVHRDGRRDALISLQGNNAYGQVGSIDVNAEQMTGSPNNAGVNSNLPTFVGKNN